MELLLAAAAMGIGRCFRFSPAKTLSFEWGAVGLGAAATLPLLALYFFASRSKISGFVKLREITEQFTAMTFERRGAWPIRALILAFSAGLGEELFFRGLIQSGLAEWIGGGAGVIAGLLIASVLFGALHFLTWLYFALAVGIGLFCGGLLILTGNLLVPITVHALYDFCVILNVMRKAKE